MQNLTYRQNQVLNYISAHLDEHGGTPTLREIFDHIVTKGTATAMLHLDALAKKVYIHRREGSRGIPLQKSEGQ